MNYDTPGIQQEGREIKITRKIEGITKERGESQGRTFRTKSLPSAEEIRRILSYDPATGVMEWRTGRREGMIAGAESKDGYRWIKVNRKRYAAHRLAWLHFYGKEPSGPLDHRNNTPLDNRIENLREATAQQNTWNAKANPRTHSGLKGAYWHKAARKWKSAIRINGKNVYLGLFDSKEDAAAAYSVAAKEAFGEFAKGSH